MGANTLHRIKEYIDFKGISIRSFEKSAGFSNGSFASQLKAEKTIGVDRVENILHVYDEINPEWLLTGNGSMLRSDNYSVVKAPSGSGTGIPLIPVSAFAGISNGDVSVLEYECERYIIPIFKDAEFMIPVKGGSMVPKYNSGDIVACKKLSLSDIFFQWNKVYVIDTDQGVLVKRIHKSDDPDKVKIVSENPDYEPFELPISRIRAVAIVIGVVRLE